MPEDKWSESVFQFARARVKAAIHQVWFVPSEITVTTVAGTVAFMMSPEAWTEIQAAVYGAVVAIAAGLAMFPLIYVVSLIVAPYRQRNEARKALTQALPLSITFGKPLCQMRAGPAPPDSEPLGWIFILADVRITNRSRTDVLNLGFTLHVGLKENPSKLPQLRLRDDDPVGRIIKQGLPSMMEWIRSPLHLEPSTTITGTMGFFVHSFTERHLGGDLSAVIDRPDGSKARYHLEVTDHVSMKTIEFRNMPGNYNNQDNAQ